MSAERIAHAAIFATAIALATVACLLLARAVGAQSINQNTESLGGGLGSVERSTGQPPAISAARAPLHVLLQVWWAESGPHAYRSHAAMAHVLQRYATAHGITLSESADRLVWQHSNAQVHRPWLRTLTASCARPDYVSERTWERRRPLCVALVERARAFMRGELRDPCPRAEGWRKRGKATRRAKRNGWAVACVLGGNAFVREA
jgi:hypothetical protein